MFAAIDLRSSRYHHVLYCTFLAPAVVTVRVVWMQPGYCTCSKGRGASKVWLSTHLYQYGRPDAADQHVITLIVLNKITVSITPSVYTFTQSTHSATFLRLPIPHFCDILEAFFGSFR